MVCHVSYLAASLPPWISNYLVWWVAGAIVVGGLVVFGLDDLVRMRFRRIWAISSVCFAESIRRKVLLVTPLAILGVIAVTLLQHAADPQEAIRQTIKFCLFASGLLVTVTAIILACTNLPREIENRVIYTIVTKPTTRLEIVLGKVLGFVRVSGLIVLIMGAFTFIYLELQNARLSGQVAERLKSETDPSTRRSLEGYQTAGLLSTKSLDEPVDMQIFEHGPTTTGYQVLSGDYGYYFLERFEPTPDEKSLLEQAASDPARWQVLVISTMKLDRKTPTKADLQWITQRKLPTESQALGPALPGQEAKGVRPIPQITVKLLDAELTTLVPAAEVNAGRMVSPVNAKPANPEGPFTFAAPISMEANRRAADSGKFFVAVLPETNSVDYLVSTAPEQPPTVLLVIDSAGKQHMIRPPTGTTPRFVSIANRYGMKIHGSSKGDGAVAMFRFAGVHLPGSLERPVDFRFRAGLERGGGDFDATKAWSLVNFTVVNRDTKEASPAYPLQPETGQEQFVPVPRQYVNGGNFDVMIQGMDDGQWIGLNSNSVEFISAEHNFALNLLESLLLLWLLSVLVVVIAIFTSTFLSWPIAIVLTLLILLGHWGVEQLGDALNPGMGRTVAQELGFGTDATQTKLVSSSVDALARMLTGLSKVLPDLSQFPVMEDITRGVSTPAARIVDSLAVLACYGLPMVVLSFVILKNKEVAP